MLFHDDHARQKNLEDTVHGIITDVSAGNQKSLIADGKVHHDMAKSRYQFAAEHISGLNIIKHPGSDVMERHDPGNRSEFGVLVIMCRSRYLHDIFFLLLHFECVEDSQNVRVLFFFLFFDVSFRIINYIFDVLRVFNR